VIAITTARRIYAHGAGPAIASILLGGIGKTTVDDEPITFARILECNRVDNALFAISTAACDCAQAVAHLNPGPRVQAAIDTARRFSLGKATIKDLNAAHGTCTYDGIASMFDRLPVLSAAAACDIMRSGAINRYGVVMAAGHAAWAAVECPNYGSAPFDTLQQLRMIARDAAFESMRSALLARFNSNERPERIEINMIGAAKAAVAAAIKASKP
jgi:hypothetical protein